MDSPTAEKQSTGLLFAPPFESTSDNKKRIPGSGIRFLVPLTGLVTFLPFGAEIKVRLRRAVAANLPPAGWI